MKMERKERETIVATFLFSTPRLSFFSFTVFFYCHIAPVSWTGKLFCLKVYEIGKQENVVGMALVTVKLSFLLRTF